VHAPMLCWISADLRNAACLETTTFIGTADVRPSLLAAASRVTRISGSRSGIVMARGQSFGCDVEL